ncbi:MAG: MBL fold metallo-hydrolase, partial [Verrucomicrobiota bacterium]
VNVMTRQRLEVGVIYPLFTHREAEKAVDRWHRCPLRQPYTTRGDRVAGEGEVTFEFWDAGHVLGSTGVFLRGEERRIFYTGDVNFDDQTISLAAAFPTEKIDVLIMECTRGDSPQPEGWTRFSEEERLIAAIGETFRRGGCVLVPVFALGKTQEILGMIYKFRQSEELAETPVYIGGLSAKMTEIYDRRAGQIRRQLPRVQLLPEVSPFVLNGDTISESTPRAGRIYALSSGMMTEKTLSNIFARRLLENPQHAIYFVGYADPQSPGGRLRAASSGDAVVLDPDQPPQELRCTVDSFQFSAHASRETLIEFAVKMAPAKVVLVHGDPPAVKWMQTQLAARLPQTEVVVPPPGISIDL